jgi:hypothetical protein
VIVVHHLNNSRSQRILWLLEELNTPYRVETSRRDAETNLVPENDDECQYRPNIQVLFDYLVGERQNFIWNDEAERLGGLQVNNEVEFGWLLDWDITWFCPAKYLVNNLGRPAEQSRKVRSIGHESPGPRNIRVSAGCRQLGV